MTQRTITGDMRVWDVIEHFPETYEVFLRHGCPDMKKGIFALSAHIMKINWAAKIHHIPVDRLLEELNLSIQTTVEASEEQQSEEPTLH